MYVTLSLLCVHVATIDTLLLQVIVGENNQSKKEIRV